MVFWILAASAVLLAGSGANAQSVDIDALKAKIAERAGNYGALVEILESADGNAALAAFDVMMESGNKTLAEMAISSGLAAADTRLRARALWESLSRRDSLVIEIDTDAVSDNEDALAQLNKWYGSTQNWTLFQKFPETQCINMVAKDSCNSGYQVSVSGLKVDLLNSYTGGAHMGMKGSFVLNPDGVLRGHVGTLEGLKFDYPASITFR
jgi:hypothetical protein